MKNKNKHKFVDYVLNEYSRIFKHHYEETTISSEYVDELLRKYKHSSMCEWHYCCYGLRENCWQEPIEDGIWNLTQEQVDKTIREIMNSLIKSRKNEGRVGVCVDGEDIHMVIVARDLLEHSKDYLFTFTNIEKY